jgi:hypothetical protein
MAGIAAAISVGRPAWFAIASNLPTAHALALSISFTSFIMSLFETMLRFDACASIDALTEARLPNATRSGFDEAERHVFVIRVAGRVVIVMGNEALALVFGHLCAVLDGQRSSIDGL